MACRQACPYNTLKGCRVKEFGGICPLTNVNAGAKMPLTNAYRIRAMTDEELGRFLAEVENRRSAAGGGAIWKGAAHAIEWLRQPVKEDFKMRDLIWREDALKATKMAYIECLIIDENDYDEAIADDMSVVFASDIKNIPAVDAVPVVRCKDCKHYEIHKPKVLENCERGGRLVPMKPDDFCSYGKRRSDETD